MSSENEPYHLILADDHRVLRLGMRTLLTRTDEFQVVGEAGNGRELLELLEKHPCRLVILDLSMPEMDGLKALDIMRTRFPDIRVLVFSMHREREFFRTALARGVDGYILKDDDLEKIPVAVREIRAGRKFFSNELTSFIAEDYAVLHDTMSLELLTRREKEIMEMIARGLTNKEIAESLTISPRTVQTHRSNIMEKLDLKNTAELVKYAIDRGVV